jgi:hypothetical protein
VAYLNYHVGFFKDTATGFHRVCSTFPPEDEFPVWIGEVKYWVFYVREGKITSKWDYLFTLGCLYPSLSPEIVLLEGTFECPGGPNLERDAKYLREIKYGKGACDEDKCKCIDFPPINQCNLPCSRENYDKRERSVCSLGCALSSLVWVMQYVGCNVDPCVVNRCNECFDDRGNVKWGIIIQKYCRDKLNSNVRVEHSPKDIQTWKTFCKDNEQGIYRILQVKLPGRVGYHFVVFKCIDDQGNILTMDPGYNIKYKPENVVSIRVIRKK